MTIGKSLFQALEFIRGVADTGFIGAYFRYDGTRVEGSEKISVELHPDKDKNEAIWWYSVTPLDDYVFVRMPVVESCAYELVGQVSGERMPDARYWRWTAAILPGRIYGGEAINLNVDFLVFGYKPKALICISQDFF